MPGMNMFPGGTTLQIPLDAPAGFTAKAGNAQVTLTWTDPKDKYATPEGETAQDPDQLVSVWDHTVLVRKTGSQPAGPNDGTVVVSSSVRDQYASSGFVDDGLTNDTAYYYAAFAYSTDGVASEGAFVNATPIAGTPLSQLAEGTLIKILENGSPVEFYLAKHSYEPDLNGAGRELLVRKDVYDQRKWNSSNANAWANCVLRSWLNSNYKNLFSSAVQALIGTTTYYYTPGNGSWSVTTRGDAVFSLSGTELNGSHRNCNVEGTALPIWSTLQLAYNSSGVRSFQWTRSPVTSDTSRAWAFDAIPGFGGFGVNTEIGSRPCFTLPATALVDQDLNLIETAVQTTALSAA